MNRAERRRAAKEQQKQQRKTTLYAEMPLDEVPPHLHRFIPWTPFERAELPPTAEAEVREIAEKFGLSEEAARRQMERVLRNEVWINSRYQVNIDRSPEIGEGWPKMIHLSIKRRDKEVIHDWRDLQRIKNELIGPEHEAVELYPAESRLVDAANQYHLWVLAEPGVRFPFGWTERGNRTHGTRIKSPPFFL